MRGALLHNQPSNAGLNASEEINLMNVSLLDAFVPEHEQV